LKENLFSKAFINVNSTCGMRPQALDS